MSEEVKEVRQRFADDPSSDNVFDASDVAILLGALDLAEARNRALVEALTECVAALTGGYPDPIEGAARGLFFPHNHVVKKAAALTEPTPPCGACEDGIVRASNHTCALGDEPTPPQGPAGGIPTVYPTGWVSNGTNLEPTEGPPQGEQGCQ